MLETPGVPDDGERISASAYGRRQDPPIGPSAMTRLFKNGLPGYPGKDAHGRDCRMVNPREADMWRAAYCTPKIGGDGKVRGLPPKGGSSERSAGSGRSPPVAPARDAVAPAANPAPAASAENEDPMSRAERIADAKMQAAEDDAATRRFRRLEAEGKYLDREAALDVLQAFTGEVGKSLDRMPANKAPVIAKALGVEAHAVYRALGPIVEEMRADLERYARSALDDVRALGRRRGLEDGGGGDPPEGEADPAPVG